MLESVPHVGEGAQGSIAVVGSQPALLSNIVPPVQDVPVLQPEIQVGSNKTAFEKLVPPPGQSCPVAVIVIEIKAMSVKNLFILDIINLFNEDFK